MGTNLLIAHILSNQPDRFLFTSWYSGGGTWPSQDYWPAFMMDIGGGILTDKLQKLGLQTGQFRVPLARTPDTGSADEGFECY